MCQPVCHGGQTPGPTMLQNFTVGSIVTWYNYTSLFYWMPSLSPIHIKLGQFIYCVNSWGQGLRGTKQYLYESWHFIANLYYLCIFFLSVEHITSVILCALLDLGCFEVRLRCFTNKYFVFRNWDSLLHEKYQLTNKPFVGITYNSY